MGQLLTYDQKTAYLQSLPGPGAHNDKRLLYKSKQPTYTIGIKLKQTLVKSDIVPGPNAYSSLMDYKRFKGPSYGFGSSKRPPITGILDGGPGPGAYKLPPKIANVPAFMLYKNKRK